MNSSAKKILIIEDDQDLVRTFTAIMENSGLAVSVAFSGKEAKNLLKRSLPDLILLDIKLPDVNGLNLIEEVKKEFTETAIIVITGHSSLDNAIRALKLGAADFFIKPVDLKALKKATDKCLWEQEKALENKRLYQEVQTQNIELEKMMKKIKKLNEELSKAYIETIKSLAEALEARDPYTKSHSDIVANYAKRIAEKMGLPFYEIKKIFQSALLHDLGKMAMPDGILNKPGLLDEKEWEEVRKHPEKSEEILKHLTFITFLPIIRHHHERFDGTGYPDKLSGDMIPLGARILAVADSFEAMTRDRSYRKALSKEHAIEEIKRCSGSQFDPKVVIAFLEVLSNEMEKGVG
ncbi:MAG: response regulator [bacterium]|nr:response regulator [bacterium]